MIMTPVEISRYILVHVLVILEAKPALFRDIYTFCYLTIYIIL